MFSTFTKLDDKTLIIRSIDLRRLEDTDHGTLLVFEECGGAQELLIQGSAAENLQRLAKEELDAALQVDAIRQKQAQGYPVPPIVRGRR
jgi:hypothetical protein